MSLFSHLFNCLDFVQLVVGIVDSVSDVMVIREFGEDPTKQRFFWICIVLVVLSSAAETAAFLLQNENRITHKISQSAVYTALLFVCTMPFAPLLSVAAFAIETWEARKKQSGDNSTDGNNDDDDEHDKEEAEISRAQIEAATADILMMHYAAGGDGQASADLARRIAIAAATLKSLDSAVVQRRITMLVSNVSVLSAGIPQCIVQLIAASLDDDGQLTTTQIVSLLLSLFSIALHAPVIARAFRPSRFVANCLFLIYDIFSLAFLTTTIFSANLGSHWMSLLWWNLFVFTCVFLFAIALLLAAWNTRDDLRNMDWRKVGVLSLGVCAAAVVAPVVGVAITGAKLSLLVLWSLARNNEAFSSGAEARRASILYEFLFRNSSPASHVDATDWIGTFAAIKKFVIEEEAREELQFEALLQQEMAEWQSVSNSNSSSSSGGGNNNNSNNNTNTAGARRPRFPPQPQNVNSRHPPNVVRKAQARMKKGRGTAEQIEAEYRLLFSRLRKISISDEEAERQQQQKVFPFNSVFTRLRFAALCSHAIVAIKLRQSSCVRAYGVLPTSRPGWKKMRDESIQASTDTNRPLFQKLIGGRLSSWQIFLFMLGFSGRDRSASGAAQRFSTMSWRDIGAMLFVCFAFLLVVICILINILFVPLSFVNYNDFNGLQRFLYVISCAVLAGCLMMMPSAMRYQLVLTSLVTWDEMLSVQPENVKIIVDEATSLPVSLLSHERVVAPEALPTDVVDSHVLPFVTNRHFGLYGMPDRDFERALAIKK